MSEPQKLQQKLAAAFQQELLQTAIGPEHPDSPAPAGSTPGSRSGPTGELLAESPQKIEPDLRRYGLAAAGLTCAILAASLALDAGYVSLWTALALGGLALLSAAFSNGLVPARAKLPPSREHSEYGQRSDATGASNAVAHFGTLHDALDQIFMVRNIRGVILHANATFCRLAGTESAEGMTFEDLGLEMTSGERQHSHEVNFQTSAGPVVYLWEDVVSKDFGSGELAVYSVARNITAERQEMRASREAALRAERETALKSELMATVSHEIRTPLSGLLGMGYLLANTRLAPEQTNYLNGMREAGTALVQLVEDLLDFSTISAGRFRLHPRSESIRPLVETVVEMLSSRAHEKGIEIGAVFDPAVPEHLTFDPERLRQVVYNIIGNAVKFTDRGGIIVFVRLNGNALEIRVKDTGPGMGKAEMQRIFTAFEQGDIGLARKGGVGLGLAISNGIVSEMGGAISVESAKGVGTTFTISLPVEGLSKAFRSGRELQGQHLLVLAPHGPAAEALRFTLEGLGANVRLASGVDEAAALPDGPRAFSGLIVDHRLDEVFRERLAQDARFVQARRVFLVNPESRPANMTGSAYDGWLIRPLREQSLIDVLTGRLKGLESRAAANDDFPRMSAHIGATRPDVHLPVEVSGKRVLFGEDDPVNAMIVRSNLENAGYRVVLASGFGGMRAMCKAESFDLILTDVSMPDGDCREFIRKIRAEEASNAEVPIPVLVLTADTREATRKDLLACGADAVLTKPAKSECLLSTMQALFATKSATRI